jgi:hypothetical protein
VAVLACYSLPVSWVTVVWSMAAAACLTLAAMHLLVWSSTVPLRGEP